MSRAAHWLAVIVAFAGSGGALAQERQQGDWPCRQIRVPTVALASVWTGPPIDGLAARAREDAEVSDLVTRLSARRTPIETAQTQIADFAKGAGARRKERLTLLFAALFDRLDGERSEVVSGLDRYGRSQKEMAEDVRRASTQLYELRDKAPNDAEKLHEASEALNWRMRVFDERRRAVTYVCETPALIEQRLGALARAIEAAME